jgi:hypothetical protein
MRSAIPLAVILALALLLGGCGSSGEETTGASTAPPGSPETTRQVRAEWARNPDCRRPAGASRWGCSVGDYRCQSVVSDRGWSTSCSKPGRSVSFAVRP